MKYTMWGACLTAAAAALAMQAPLASAQDAKSLQLRSLAATCAGCHGTDGNALPEGGMARLAGADATVITERLRGYRDGSQKATVMHQIVKGYSDEQIASLAAYFAARK